MSNLIIVKIIFKQIEAFCRSESTECELFLHLITPLCNRPGGTWLFTRCLAKILPGQTNIHQVDPEFFTREANDVFKI